MRTELVHRRVSPEIGNMSDLLMCSIKMKRSICILAAKMVHFEAKWIGCLSLIVKCSLVIGCLYLMFQRDSYQISDRSPISAVLVKVKQGSYCSRNSSISRHFVKYNCTKSLFDVNDFILPATENSAVSITTRIVQIEHILKPCNHSRMPKKSTSPSLDISSKHKCYHRSRCILPPFYRYDYDHDDIFQDPELCWFKLPPTPARFNYEALDYIIFIKHFIEFPQLDHKQAFQYRRFQEMNQYLSSFERDQIGLLHQ